jgi:Sugar (and other) transporter
MTLVDICEGKLGRDEEYLGQSRKKGGKSLPDQRSEISPEKTESEKPYQKGIVALFKNTASEFIIGFAMSAGPIIWVLCSEIYPLAGRDLGVTFSTATNWIANAIVGMTPASSELPHLRSNRNM